MWLGLRMGLLKNEKDFGVNLNAPEKKQIDFLKATKFWRIIAGAILAVGIFFTATNGLNMGLDFTGGTRLVMEIGSDFDKEVIDAIVKNNDADAITQKVDGTQIEVRSQKLTTESISPLVKEIQAKYTLEEDSVVKLDEIGASVGKELTSNGIKAVIVAVIFILAYVSLRFKKNYGIATIVALIHDILLTLALFAIFNVPINTPFIAAMLTILGYSINDTIVIFDRVRENLKLHPGLSNRELITLSLNQSFMRSIGTLATTLFTIVSVVIFVPQIRDFAVPISVGVFLGGISTIFIACPLWIYLEKRSKTKVA
jgi:preprotein translocase SecF subunit